MLPANLEFYVRGTTIIITSIPATRMNWLSSLVNEYEGKPLQKTGMLTKDQLQVFFQKSKEQFTSPGFKQLLRSSAQRGRDLEQIVNEMQTQIFQAMGVQGDFGINCLGRVQQAHNDDAFFLRAFFEHVQLEEQTLDEAEMPEEAFKQKYTQMAEFKAQMEKKLDAMHGLTPEEQQKYMAKVCLR